MSFRYLLFACMFFASFQAMAQPGALDRSFGERGVAVTTEQLTQYQRILPLSSGQFLVTSSETASHTQGNGFTESATFSVFRRINANGSSDLTYGTNGKIRFISSDLSHQFFTSFGRLSDGSIVALETYGYNGNYTPQNRVWKFNPDGTGRALIAELSVAGFHSTHLQGITVDDANRIVVTGWVKRTGAGNQTYIARLLSDGSFDESFNNNIGFRILVEDLSKNYSGEQVTTDRSNNIIVVEDGYYSAGLGFVHGHYMFKFPEDGSARTFTNIKLDGQIKSLVTDNNSKIIAHTSVSIKRYNTDGSLDKTILSPANSIRKVIVQPDGKIVAIAPLSMNGHNVFSVTRYGTDGNLDQAFGSSGNVTTDLNFESLAQDVIYRNRRLYVSGQIVVPINNAGVPFGTIAAYDASDVRMTCPTPANPYSVDIGKCEATINNINAVMSTSTLWANVQNTVVHNGITTTGEGGVAGQKFQIGKTDITYSYTDITTQSCAFSVTAADDDPPVAKCKNITVPLVAGNATITAAQLNNGSTDGCGLQSMSVSLSTFNCSNIGTNNVTFTVTDVNGNSTSCTAVVTIQDNTPPVVRTKGFTAYLNTTGTVTITTTNVDDGSSDECGSVSLSIDKTSFTCTDKGPNTVVLTVTDPNGNSASGTAVVNVVDNIPPTILSVTATPSSIWPADRKMHPVTIAAVATDNCEGTTWSVTSVSIKAGEFANDNINPDHIITDFNTVNLRAEIPKKGIKRVYTITVTARDASNNITTSTVDVTVSYNITSPRSGATYVVGSSVLLEGEFWDLPGKKHSAKWLLDGSTSLKAPLTEPSGNSNGTVKGSYKFTTAGVYKLQMNVTDQNGVTAFANTAENLEAIIVVYDPNGGYTYGGGSFYSPVGALKANPDALGDVSYGFTVNYYKGAATPKGETQFNFKLGDFEYNALNFEYLAISGAKAQFKGTGRIIGGQSGVSFIMTVIDGQLDDTGIDKIRMKIYNKNTGQIYYDNQSWSGDATNPTTAVGLNSTIVIQNNSTVTSVTKMEQEAEVDKFGADDLKVTALPNPTRNDFTINVKTANTKEKIMVQVFDVNGRLLEARSNIGLGSFKVGNHYKSGAYFLRITQGKERKEIKLTKLSN